jgi:hypothetical protein
MLSRRSTPASRQGYLDITYVALVVWAAALEASAPPGPAVFAAAAAGLLRPDAWVLSGLYWICVWPAIVGSGDWPGGSGYLALAVLARSCG